MIANQMKLSNIVVDVLAWGENFKIDGVIGMDFIALVDVFFSRKDKRVYIGTNLSN